MAEIPLYQQCRDHRDECGQCNNALIVAARGYGYGSSKGCMPDSRLAFPDMCAEGVKIWKARHEEMRTKGGS